jgi:hypothetical protein
MDEVNRDPDEGGDLLTWLDRDVPPLSADDVIGIARRRRNWYRSMSHGTLWAASLAGFLVAAIVAAAIPGSPVRKAVQGLFDSGTDTSSEAMTSAASSRPGSGVSLTPGRELEIIFEATQAQGSVEILLQGTERATIEVEGGSVGLVVGDQSVTIQNRDAAVSYRIVLPEDLPRAVIRVGNRTIFAKKGASYQVAVGEERSDKAYRVPFSALPAGE